MDVNGDDVVVSGDVVTELECRDNEYAYMFYHNLGGSRGDEFHIGDTTIGDVTIYNIQTQAWSSTEFVAAEDYVWTFLFYYYEPAQQTIARESSEYSAWAVHDGDIGAVPIPGAIWLLGSGLIGLVGFRKKIRKEA